MDREYDPKEHYLMVSNKYLMWLSLLSIEQKWKLFSALIDKQLWDKPELEDTEIQALYWILVFDLNCSRE